MFNKKDRTTRRTRAEEKKSSQSEVTFISTRGRKLSLRSGAFKIANRSRESSTRRSRSARIDQPGSIKPERQAKLVRAPTQFSRRAEELFFARGRRGIDTHTALEHLLSFPSNARAASVQDDFSEACNPQRAKQELPLSAKVYLFLRLRTARVFRKKPKLPALLRVTAKCPRRSHCNYNCFAKVVYLDVATAFQSKIICRLSSVLFFAQVVLIELADIFAY